MEESPERAETRSAPAGWYVDPISGDDRYWDGQAWTDQIKKTYEGLIYGGYFAAWFLPPVGLGIGIFVLARGRTNHGLGIIAVAIVFGVLQGLYLAAALG